MPVSFQIVPSDMKTTMLNPKKTQISTLSVRQVKTGQDIERRS